MKIMVELLAISTTVKIIIGVLVGVIVLSIVMHFINRAFRIRYDLNLFGGGLLMILAIGGAVLGAFALSGKINAKALIYVGFGVALVFSIITLVYDCKKCGGMGVVAFLCQLVFAPGALFLVFSFFSNPATSGLGDRREERRIQEERRRRGYDQNDRFKL